MHDFAPSGFTSALKSLGGSTVQPRPWARQSRGFKSRVVAPREDVKAHHPSIPLEDPPMKKTILIIDSDSDTMKSLGAALCHAGYEAIAASDGSAGLAAALTQPVALVVVDAAVPLLSGFEVCRQLKQVPATQHLPVMFLIGKGGERERIRGLELGAADCISKPFNTREVVLRIQRLVGQAPVSAPARIVRKVGAFEIDGVRHQVRVRGQVVNLTALEFRLITLFVENVGEVLDRGRMLEVVWGYVSHMTTRTVDTHVMRLRAKLGEAGDLIETVRGVGYRLQEDKTAPMFHRLGSADEERNLAAA
jgi:two-component system phosphate regulon response regulator PhoB